MLAEMTQQDVIEMWCDGDMNARMAAMGFQWGPTPEMLERWYEKVQAGDDAVVDYGLNGQHWQA